MRDARRAVLVVCGAVVVAGATIVALRGDTAHATAKRDQTATITREQVRYRFAIEPRVRDSDPLAAIGELEARVANPFAASELADLYLRRAQRTGDARDFARAEEAAQRSLALLPAPNAAGLTLARVATARHDFRAAIRIARDQLAHAPSPAAYTILATAHLALGELSAAAEAADATVTEKPSSGAYVMRALVFAAQGRDAEAAYDFGRAVGVEDFGDLEAAVRTRSLWARFLIRRGDLAGAAVVLDEALRIAPEDALALGQRGELALRRGEDARPWFERAFTASRQVRYLIDQARAQDLAGDARAAVTRAQVEKLVRAELQTSTGHTLDLVEILVDRATPADLEEAIALGTDELARRASADVRFQLARAYHRAARPRDGLVQIRAALASGIRDARVYELAARLEAAVGNAPRGAMYRREADALDPDRRAWRTYGMTQGAR